MTFFIIVTIMIIIVSVILAVYDYILCFQHFLEHFSEGMHSFYFPRTFISNSFLIATLCMSLFTVSTINCDSTRPWVHCGGFLCLNFKNGKTTKTMDFFFLGGI
uniref:Uncharacterized protein n=1 Tax=Anguilla anguilla TaxID=7936 RepID=A0A0E9WW50_ANGAN